jgi:hypothetical protein
MTYQRHVFYITRACVGSHRHKTNNSLGNLYNIDHGIVLVRIRLFFGQVRFGVHAVGDKFKCSSSSIVMVRLFCFS